jgi:hypothetical protein
MLVRRRVAPDERDSTLVVIAGVDKALTSLQRLFARTFPSSSKLCLKTLDCAFVSGKVSTPLSGRRPSPSWRLAVKKPPSRAARNKASWRAKRRWARAMRKRAALPSKRVLWTR